MLPTSSEHHAMIVLLQISDPDLRPKKICSMNQMFHCQPSCPRPCANIFSALFSLSLTFFCSLSLWIPSLQVHSALFSSLRLIYSLWDKNERSNCWLTTTLKDLVCTRQPTVSLKFLQQRLIASLPLCNCATVSTLRKRTQRHFHRQPIKSPFKELCTFAALRIAVVYVV